ncbi:MAG: GGDEF domain-containing protein [Nitrospirae bacterium]|nr:GGDEF domain-containing protein [Nitrospirota bacterium]
MSDLKAYDPNPDSAKLQAEIKRFKEELELEIQERKRAQEILKELRAQLREQAIRDPLTGLFNRRYLNEIFDRELVHAKRDRRTISVILGDLDFFKNVNNFYGQPAGDSVLNTFGTLMKSHSRSKDICCRFGGEEFLLVLFDMKVDGALARAERLRAIFENNPIIHEEFVIRTTASFGVAVFPDHGETADLLIAAADTALYAAKNAGRNTVRCYAVSGQPVE